MNKGIKTAVYPVKDIAKAKALFRELLGLEPYADAPSYVGFKVGKQDIGLDPNGHKEGMTVYYHVDAGAKQVQEIKDVGGGGLIASVKDADGNIIGLIQGG